MRHQIKLHYTVLSLFLIVGMIGSLFMGNTPWPVLWEKLLNHIDGSDISWNPLLHERIPRLIVILCSGSALAVSGAVTQSLFNNPLASPSVLGITFGGSLLVVITFIMGWHVAYPYTIPIAAFIGSILTLLLVYTISRKQGTVYTHSLILNGIAISTLLLAAQGTLLYALRDQWHLIQTLTEWEAGNTMNKTWKDVHMQLPLTLIGLWGCWTYRKEVDVLSLGEEEALNLGVDVAKIRWRLFLCIALLMGGTIATVGIIGFFGLVFPHLFRNLYGARNQLLIPLCALGGPTVLLYFDVLLRFFQIHALSIGNISSVLGGIFFLILLIKKQRQISEPFPC